MNSTPRLIGYPRIGPNRELKWTLEKAWSGRLDAVELRPRIQELRAQHLDEQSRLIGSAVDDYFLYDEVLETALMLGLVPDDLDVGRSGEPFEVLTALARGTSDREAWEMTKWFDTNYHYVVPEISRTPDTFRPVWWREPTGAPNVTWSVLGPFSLVKLSKLADGVDSERLATAVAAAIGNWIRSQAKGFAVQLDEPCLGMALSEADRRLRDAAYDALGQLELESPAIITVQFGHAAPDTVEALGRRGHAVQVDADRLDAVREAGALDVAPALVIAVMDGRSVWPDGFERARAALASLPPDDRPLSIVPATSLMFLPYTVEGENLPAGFQFAREKATALAAWADALAQGTEPPGGDAPRAEWPAIRDLAARAPRSARRDAQADLNLPPFPTTTTGSLPQTVEIRQLRRRRDRGEIDAGEYETAIAKHITDSIGWQERMGLDVLVHGEFERTDMVEYFAERMDGFHTTRNGWVNSYGSRCVRAPILAAPPSISEPMTVREWKLAQSATEKPVKGMLTGPVTIVNWSFRPPGVADDRLFWAVAQPIAEEVRHLVEAGARVIQVDEPAVRERWPLPTDEADRLREIYARGVRAALNHVFNQPAHVQMHTHMCYGDFGDIVPLWADAGVDVASIEFSRSKDDSYIRQFYELFTDGRLQIGPGVFDVHSPHTPGRDTMKERLDHFRAYMDESDLWVNPDCGLKTRGWDEIERQLGDMVAAAESERRVPVG